MATDVFPINGTSRKIYMILSCPYLVSVCAAPTFCKRLREAETETRGLFEALGMSGYQFPGDRRGWWRGNSCERVPGEAAAHPRGRGDGERAPSTPWLREEQLLRSQK